MVRDVGQDTAAIEQLHGLPAIVLLVVTFVALFLVAAHQVRERRLRKDKRSAVVETSSSPAGAPHDDCRNDDCENYVAAASGDPS
jgi:hypothetical protein